MARGIMRFLRWVLRWLIVPILYVLLILAALTAACLVWRHIGLLTGAECPKMVVSYADWTAEKFLRADVKTLHEEGKFAAVLSDMVVALAFVVAVVPLIQAWGYKRRLRRELREKQGLEVYKVKKVGRDDMAKMLEFYEGAQHIIVFCGGFDWLQPEALRRPTGTKGVKWLIATIKYYVQQKRMKKAIKLVELVKNLAQQNKITLVSFRSQEEVSEQLGGEREGSLFKLLEERFVFNSEVEVKCSLIKRSDVDYTFLYRSFSSQDPHKLFNACIFKGTDESRELINIVTGLVRYGKWEDKAGEHLRPTEAIETKKEQG